jgi:hypothetical protein
MKENFDHSFEVVGSDFSGRIRKPFWKKLTGFAWWWWMNDDDPGPPDWYHPEWSSLRRWLTWHAIRNPLHNFAHYVLGVKDRNFTVIGTGPTTDKLDIGELGWCWNVIQRGPEIFIPRPYVSHTGHILSWHIGWMWDGAFGCRIILR